MNGPLRGGLSEGRRSWRLGSRIPCYRGGFRILEMGLGPGNCKGEPTGSIVLKLVKIFKTEKKTIEIQPVRPTEVCGNVYREKDGYKSVKTSLLLSNVIDADHQNSCLFTNKGHCALPLWNLIGVLAKFHE